MIPARTLAAAWQRVFGTVPCEPVPTEPCDEAETPGLAERVRAALPVPDYTSVYASTPSAAAQHAARAFRAESAVLGELADLTVALDDPEAVRRERPDLAGLAVSHGSPWAAAHALFGAGE